LLLAAVAVIQLTVVAVVVQADTYKVKAALVQEHIR
jgi:hypothetical protein